MNFLEFARKHNVYLSSTSTALRTTDKNGGFRYNVEIHFAGKAHPVNFFKGSGHIGIKRSRYNGMVIPSDTDGTLKEWRNPSAYEISEFKKGFSSKVKPIPPYIEEVLEALSNDYRSIRDCPYWPEFASEWGINVDSISGRATFDKTVDEFLNFRKLLGYSLFNEFLECTEE